MAFSDVYLQGVLLADNLFRMFAGFVIHRLISQFLNLSTQIWLLIIITVSNHCLIFKNHLSVGYEQFMFVIRMACGSGLVLILLKLSCYYGWYQDQNENEAIYPDYPDLILFWICCLSIGERLRCFWIFHWFLNLTDSFVYHEGRQWFLDMAINSAPCRKFLTGEPVMRFLRDFLFFWLEERP